MQAKLVFVASYCFVVKFQSTGSEPLAWHQYIISGVLVKDNMLLPARIEAGVEIPLSLVWKVETDPKPIFLKPRAYFSYHRLGVARVESSLPNRRGAGASRAVRTRRSNTWSAA